MPRKPTHAPIACQYLTWLLFRRAGVYYADGRGGKYHVGKHSLGTRDRDEALERLKLLDQRKAFELGLADSKAIQPAEQISVADGWQLYLDFSGRAPVMGGASPGTIKRYRTVRDKHTKYCAKHGIATWNDFDKQALVQYGNSISKQCAERTVYVELTLLKSVSKWLVKENKLPAAAKLEYDLRKPQGTDTYCYSKQEVAAMIDHCLAATTLVWLAHVILALAHTGLRISELASLRWCDVDLNSNTIRVADERSSSRKRRAGIARTTKGRRSRTIPIHPRLRALLDGLEHKPDGYVFHAARGGHLHPRTILETFISDVIEPLKATFPTPSSETGFEHGRLHSFRHYFCSQSFLGGASEGEIKEWLGHADSRMVEHYRHLRNEDAQRKMKKIDFGGGEPKAPAAGAM